VISSPSSMVVMVDWRLSWIAVADNIDNCARMIVERSFVVVVETLLVLRPWKKRSPDGEQSNSSHFWFLAFLLIHNRKAFAWEQVPRQVVAALDSEHSQTTGSPTKKTSYHPLKICALWSRKFLEYAM
jgi:hypothetical protein